MLAKIKIWLLQLPGSKQLLVLFIFYWIFWFSTELLMVYWIDEEAQTIGEVLLGSLFITICWLLTSHFDLLTQLFKKNPVQSSLNDT